MLNSRSRKPPRNPEIWKKPPNKLWPNSREDQVKERKNSIESTENSTLPRKISRTTWKRSKDSKELLMMIQTTPQPLKNFKMLRMPLKDLEMLRMTNKLSSTQSYSLKVWIDT